MYYTLSLIRSALRSGMAPSEVGTVLVGLEDGALEDALAHLDVMVPIPLDRDELEAALVTAFVQSGWGDS